MHGKGVAKACTIGLSINENLKLEKGKEKSSSAARSYVQSSSHVTATCHYVMAICRNLTVVCQCRNSTKTYLLLLQSSNYSFRSFNVIIKAPLIWFIAFLVIG